MKRCPGEGAETHDAWSYGEYRNSHAKRGYRVRRGRKLTARQLWIFNEAKRRLGDQPTEARIQNVLNWIEGVR